MSTLSTPEITRLDRFLRAHEKRFALAIVRIPQIPLREEFARWVEEFSREHHRPFHRFELSGVRPDDAWGRIQAGVATGAVTIWNGLDASFLDPDSDMASLLNRQRERIAELLPGPVLLVLGDRALNRFRADAPDLADWYAASFEFEGAVVPAEREVQESQIPERSREWIESRIALLQNQLRGTMRDRTRARVLMELGSLYRDSIYSVPSDSSQSSARTAAESRQVAESALCEAVDIERRLSQRDSDPGTERDLALALDALGRFLNDAGRYAETEPLFVEALRVHEQTLGGEHPATLSSVNNLAASYERQGRYEEAEPLYQRALAASERVLGAEHPNTVISVDNLAGLYANQGRYAEAEPLSKRALADSERVLGDEHPNTLRSVNNLAILYKNQGRYSEAEPLYQRALAARERMLGSKHPDTLGSVNNLANLYAAQGRYAEAEPLYKRALAAMELMLGREHPDTLTTVINLAALYMSQGRYTEAEPLCERALAASKRLLGREHPATLRSLNNLGASYEDQGRYAEAEPLLQQALAGRERVLGVGHPDTLSSANNLAGVYANQGRYEEAERLFRQALTAAEEVLGPNHPDTQRYRSNLEHLRSSTRA